MTQLPNTRNVFEVIYRYRMKNGLVRDFYLEGEEVKKFMSNIGGASIMGITHGVEFSSLNWKIRKVKNE